jgi:Glycosyltransferase sugar-binding region containing DXD motif
LRVLLGCVAASTMMLLHANHLCDSLLPPVAVPVPVPVSTLADDPSRSALLASGRRPNPVPKHRRPTLDEITASNATACPPGLVYLSNHVPRDGDGRTSNAGMPPPKPTAIPRIVHQTSKSRCVTQEMADAAAKWKFDNWSYYFYDDEAVGRLIASEADSFPQIDALFRTCMPHGALKSDVFRYLVLHRHGGIYADLDSGPNALDPKVHLPDTVDAFFVVELYGMLSQYFMVSSPKHPLMWYAVRHSLANLVQERDTGRIAVAMKTGPHALHNAFALFRQDVGAEVPHSQSRSIRAGVYAGTRNRSITVHGVAENSNELVVRDVFHGTKKRHYKMMNMTHFRDDYKTSSNRSCLSLMYELVSEDE